MSDFINDNNDSNSFYSLECWLNYSKFSEHLEEVSGLMNAQYHNVLCFLELFDS